jgi:glutathione S-transferase
MDGEFRLIESLAILDYLETLYPSPSLLPQFPQAQAKMRMVQMVTANELMPKLPLVLSRLSSDVVEGTIVTREAISDISPGLDRGLQFLNEQLSEIRSERTLETNLEQQTYFVENRLTLADIVVGSTIPLLCRLGISLLPYPALHQWRGTIGARQPWQQTEPSEEDFQRWRRWLQVTIKRRQRNPAS